MVEVEPHRAAHIVHSLDDPDLIHLAPAQREAGLFVAAGDAQLIAQLRPLAQHQILPVRPAPRRDRREVHGLKEDRVAVGAGGDGGRTLVPGLAVSRGVALELGPLWAVHHGHAAQRLLGPGVGVVRDGRFPALPLLRGDEHHTARAACAVDCRGRRILQDFDRLDVVRIQIADAARHRDAVQHIERIVGRRQRSCAPHPDTHAVPGVVTARDDVDAGHAPLDRLDRVDLGHGVHVLARHRCLRPGHVSPDLRAVAHHDDFLKGDR